MNPHVALSDGAVIPTIGFGVWQVKPEQTEAAVSHTAGTAVVTLSAPVDDAALKAAVEAKDYTVTGIA